MKTYLERPRIDRDRAKIFGLILPGVPISVPNALTTVKPIIRRITVQPKYVLCMWRVLEPSGAPLGSGVKPSYIWSGSARPRRRCHSEPLAVPRIRSTGLDMQCWNMLAPWSLAVARPRTDRMSLFLDQGGRHAENHGHSGSRCRASETRRDSGASCALRTAYLTPNREEKVVEGAAPRTDDLRTPSPEGSPIAISIDAVANDARCVGARFEAPRYGSRYYRCSGRIVSDKQDGVTRLGRTERDIVSTAWPSPCGHTSSSKGGADSDRGTYPS